jgi:hypothetical protein
VDGLIPGVTGVVVLVVIDEIRGESAPWWLVVLIFAAAVALYQGFRYLRSRRRR